MTKKAEQQNLAHDHGRGEIKGNALAALVTSRLFRCKSEKAKKGRGSYSRRAKHIGKEPYQNTCSCALIRLFQFSPYNLNL
ncbi:alternative ribosome-rescue factor A [Photobacterium damselae]|uniref:alternative ribosome-rescue factor A n=1 Tax=Photobacterium damselae TaxID=38293 RepID=UPI001F465A00|nr:ribosome alternative rescue factor ArfA [Photobacterium damselae]UKA05009.1 ribosome alternative rescue factor ArfA [Photobacterium damselae subsp. damselae]